MILGADKSIGCKPIEDIVRFKENLYLLGSHFLFSFDARFIDPGKITTEMLYLSENGALLLKGSFLQHMPLFSLFRP